MCLICENFFLFEKAYLIILESVQSWSNFNFKQVKSQTKLLKTALTPFVEFMIRLCFVRNIFKGQRFKKQSHKIAIEAHFKLTYSAVNFGFVQPYFMNLIRLTKMKEVLDWTKKSFLLTHQQTIAITYRIVRFRSSILRHENSGWFLTDCFLFTPLPLATLLVGLPPVWRPS